MSARYPKRNRQWETGDNDLAVVLLPKFGSHALGRWLRAQMKKPDYRLNLDEIGSFVWNCCDGSKSVEAIAEALRQRFGDQVHPANERLGLFLKSLEKSKSIIWV